MTPLASHALVYGLMAVVVVAAWRGAAVREQVVMWWRWRTDRCDSCRTITADPAIVTQDLFLCGDCLDGVISEIDHAYRRTP